MWLWVSNCTDGETVKQSTFGTGQGLLHSLNIYSTGPISLAQKCTSGETVRHSTSHSCQISERLDENWGSLFDLKLTTTDGRMARYRKSSADYVSSGANNTKTAHKVVWRSPYLSTVIMTSWHGKAFCITGLFNWESNGHRWILHTKGRVYPKYSHTKNPYHDVIKWKHFPRYWPFVRGIHRSPVNSPHQGQWRGALMFSFICTWINGWVNNREAGDLRCHRDHYDVTVMSRSRGWGAGSLFWNPSLIYMLGPISLTIFPS